MNSLTRICQALTPGSRQGRSRRDRSYQSISSGAWTRSLAVNAHRRHNVAMPNTSPITAWKALKEGNERFVAGRPHIPARASQHRASLAAGQKPTAVVFGCADSRVAAEIIFDQGLGDMFVVRTAGQAIDSAVLGSIEYAVTVLDVPLVVVLGHDSCGAVKAAIGAIDDGAIARRFRTGCGGRVAPSILRAGETA